MSAPRILVVDDNPPLRYALGRTLRQHDFEVIEAGTGEEAIRLAGSEQPDLVLLDVNLPDIHGFDVARRLKASERTKAVPILQISASFVQMEHRMEGLAAGADGYLVQPVEPAELVANIRALLRMRDAEAGLLRTTAMLTAVVDASPLAIVVFDRDGVVRTWNPAAARLFGAAGEDVVGRPGAAAVPSVLSDPAVRARLNRGEAVNGLEQRYQRQDGSAIDVSVFAAPLDRSASPGYVALVEDISGRKAFERERTELLTREREARRDAEAANRLKDEFLATLSHELRTPLNAIMGWARMLLEQPLEPDARQHGLEVIARNAKSQHELIHDILDVSKIIRGELRLDLQPVDVVDVLGTAIEAVRPTAAAKRQQLEAALAAGPVLVAADRERLQQVFWNLLTNALKYTPLDGRIEVMLTGNRRHVDVVVRDSGIGIAADVLPHVFERFRQGDGGPAREFGGLGLGLAIVRHLTEMHGGTVLAHSAGTGEGATFTVTLPTLAR